MPRFILLLTLTAPLPSASPNGGAALWYEKPAVNWNEALPIGNGSLGGMIFADPAKERIRANGKIEAISLPPGGRHIITI